MIKNKEALRSLEKALLRREKANFFRNLRMVEALHKEALFLGEFPPRNRLAGIEVDIKIARVIHSVSKTP